jgi:hypothetical protein
MLGGRCRGQLLRESIVAHAGRMHRLHHGLQFIVLQVRSFSLRVIGHRPGSCFALLASGGLALVSKRDHVIGVVFPLSRLFLSKCRKRFRSSGCSFAVGCSWTLRAPQA